MSKDLSRSLRLTQLQNYLSMKSPFGGVTIHELVNHFGLTKRQIYRDLDDIENTLKLKLIRPKRGQKETGKYKLDENLPLKIGPETAAIIFLSMLRQKGSPLAPKINEIKDILIAALFKNRYSSGQDNIERLQDRIHIVEEQLLNDEKPGRVLIKLMEAIKDCRVVTVKYFKPFTGEYSRRDIEPYGLTSKHNNWYLVGFCRKSGSRKTFRMDLIEDVHVLSEKFQYPDDFSLKDYFGDSWGIYSEDEAKKIVIKVVPELESGKGVKNKVFPGKGHLPCPSPEKPGNNHVQHIIVYQVLFDSFPAGQPADQHGTCDYAEGNHHPPAPDFQAPYMKQNGKHTISPLL